jgi:hypothetical protein
LRDLKPKLLEEMDLLANGKPANMALLLEAGQRTGPVFIGREYPSPYFDLPGWGG